MDARTRLGVTLYVSPLLLNVKPDDTLVNVEMFAFGLHTPVTPNALFIARQSFISYADPWEVTSDSCQIK